jgi:hypothetical protein
LDTVEFRHAYCTILAPMAEDRIVQGLHAVTDVLTDTPPPTTIYQPMRSPISGMCLNRGTSWLLHRLGFPESQCPAVQGWSRLTHLVPNILLRHRQTSSLGQHGRLHPRQSQIFVSAAPTWPLSLQVGLCLPIFPLQ